jgi:hypothetical protein
MKQDPNKQLKELWRTIRKNAKAFGPLVRRMNPKDVQQIKELWRTIRKAQKRKPRRKR